MTEQVDTTEMFSKLDKLRTEWQESTGRIQKVEPSQKNLTREKYRDSNFCFENSIAQYQKPLLSMNINETFNE